MTAINADDRHPATQQITRWFDFQHLPTGTARKVSASCAGLAEQMLADLDDGPELTAGLRHLLEAKDAFVRQAIADQQAASAR